MSYSVELSMKSLITSGLRAVHQKNILITIISLVTLLLKNFGENASKSSIKDA